MNYLKTLADALRSLGLLHSDIEKISNQIESATTEYKAQNDKEQSAPVVNAVLHRPQTEIDSEEARAARQETRDTNRLRLEAAAVIAGGIVAIATLGQLMLTKRAVNIAAVSADAAQKGVNATQQSIETTVKQFQLDQRAWVGPIQVSQPPEFKVDPDLRGYVVITNTGKSPALSEEHTISEMAMPRKMKFAPQYGKNESPITGKSAMQPNAWYKVPVWANPPISGDFVKWINSGDLRLYLFGTITYLDIFQQRHRTTFCYWFDTSDKSRPAFSTCDTYNEAD